MIGFLVLILWPHYKRFLQTWSLLFHYLRTCCDGKSIPKTSVSNIIRSALVCFFRKFFWNVSATSFINKTRSLTTNFRIGGLGLPLIGWSCIYMHKQNNNEIIRQQKIERVNEVKLNLYPLQTQVEKNCAIAEKECWCLPNQFIC